jgi:hypothetical protein
MILRAWYSKSYIAAAPNRDRLYLYQIHQRPNQHQELPMTVVAEPEL